MNSEIVLEATGLERTFRGTGTDIAVLRGVDLTVRRAEVVGIVGASGVGKSTLLHILGTLDPPDAGRVVIGGEDVRQLAAARLDRLRNEGLGFVFQFHFLLPEFSALENVMMPLLVRRRPRAEAAAKARALLERVGLGERTAHKPGELSGGEQQRVAVARALVGDPAVVLADEPTGNLDDDTGEEVHALIRSLADSERRTFVVVTHKRAFARHADRVLVLADGMLAPLE